MMEVAVKLFPVGGDLRQEKSFLADVGPLVE
jgi:hypothetical protein